MHNAAYCRRQAESFAEQARDPQLPSRRRTVLEHLSRSWATCAVARELFDKHAFDKQASDALASTPRGASHTAGSSKE